jgi:hypothetical protein
MGAEAAAGATEVDLAGGALAEDNGTLSHRSLGCHVYAQDSTCGRLYYAYTTLILRLYYAYTTLILRLYADIQRPARHDAKWNHFDRLPLPLPSN